MEEIQGYMTDKKGEYIKKRDHAIDDLRYFFDFINYNYSLKPESDVRVYTEDEGRAYTGANAFGTTDDFSIDEDLWN